MSYLNSLESWFDFNCQDPEYLYDVFEFAFDSPDDAKPFLKALSEIQIETDIQDIRLATNENFNPGPFVLIGVPINLNDARFSLIPSMTGMGVGNRNSIIGLVTQPQNPETPDFVFGFRKAITNAPRNLPMVIEEELSYYFLGEFSGPRVMRSFDADLTEDVLITFLGYLSYAFGLAALEAGLASFQKESKNLDKSLEKLWSDYLRTVTNVIQELSE